MCRYLRWNLLIGLLAVLAVACADETAATTSGHHDNADDGEPVLAVSGEEGLSWELSPGASGTAQFEVSNIGEGRLEFSIGSGEWLTLDPADGQVGADETVAVEANASCHTKFYDTESTMTVQITSNGGDYQFDVELICGTPTGTLEVIVEGLPDDQEAAIAIDGANDFFENITGTQIFDEMELGDYTIVAEPVGQDAVYTPLVEETSVTVGQIEVASVTIEYEAVPGSVLVHTDGLEADAEPDMKLVRDGDEWSVPADGLVQNLVPGNYTVVADDYEEEGIIYEASDVTVTVVSDEVVEITIIYLIDAGYLEVNVDGLPQGMDHDIDVVADSDGAVTAVPQTGDMTLMPDTYEVEPKDVEDGLATYEAGSATVDINSGITTTVDIDYEQIPGQLPVVIGGDLPAGVDADIDLVGAQESKNVVESDTVELIPDVYDIEVHDVVDGPTTYRALSTVADDVTVESGTNGVLAIDYESVPAQLHVEITGDLDGNDADVDLVGPTGLMETLTESETFADLDPGDYTVDARDVFDGSAVYEATGGQTLTLESDDVESITVDYELVTGDIEVFVEEIGDVVYQVELSGPDGFHEVLDGDASFSGAPVGDYDITVVDAPVDPYGNDSYIEYLPADFVLDAGQEQVVDIEVQAAYMVVNEDDSGQGSLRFVVDDVIDGTIIEFTDDVSEIVLSTGEMAVVKDIAIAGPVADPVIVDGDDGSRIFYVDAGGHLSITDLVLRNGFADPGGAVRVVGDGHLSVGRTTFENNSSAQSGGAISVEDVGVVDIYDSLFAGNTADGWGSAIDAPGGTADVDVAIRRSLFRDNVADGNGGAVDTSGTLTIEHSTFVHNESGGRVAAIMVFSGTAILEGVTVVENSIDTFGAPDFDDTAGVYVNWDADLTIRSSIVSDNTGGDLGGTVENFISSGFNVIGEVDDDFDEAPSDLLDVHDPELEVLADNGGYTHTMALGDNSQARALMMGDQCSQGSSLSWSGDQRGAYRPAGAFCSAGAYELDATVETFDDADMSQSTFNTAVESFVGIEAIEWDYYQTKRQEESDGDPGAIDGTTVVLKGDQGWIAAQDIDDGIASISMLLAPVDTAVGERRVEVLVDGVSIGTSPDVSDEAAPYLYAVELDDDIDQEFDLSIESIGDQDVAVDNISWR